jgi:glycosyltransferase involved in cell wall biosynthesis
MNFKKITLLSTLLIGCTLIVVCYILFTQGNLKFVNFETATKNQSEGPRVLFVHVTQGSGGAETHSIALYKEALSHGMNATMLVQKNSFIQQELKQFQIPHYETSAASFIKMSKLYKYILTKNIQAIHKKQPIDIVQCNTERETYAAKKAQLYYPIKVIWVRHNEELPRCMQVLKNLNGIIAVSPQIEQLLTHANKQYKLDIDEIRTIYPFFNQERLLSYNPQESRKIFFQKYFNLSVDNNTVLLCMVANLYSNIDHKNHPLLLKATAKLIHEKQKNIQVLLVGDGRARSELEKQCSDLNISKYVHFLGFTAHVPAILYHSDIKVLSSRSEGQAIALTEAAFMQKPLIAATGTSAVNIVIDGKTGYLFRNNNADDLAEKIEILVDNPLLRIQMGKAAQDLAFKEFANASKLKKLKKFYQRLK